jgi:hypothetical protein
MGQVGDIGAIDDLSRLGSEVEHRVTTDQR